MTSASTRKPTRREDFSQPVSWLVGRDLIAGLKWFALFAAFKGKLDPRDWMSGNVFPRFREEDKCLEFWRARNDHNWDWKVKYDKFWAEENARKREFWKANEGTPEEDFWFDFIADSGDGQIAGYGVAYLCMSDLWLSEGAQMGARVSFEKPMEQATLLPRGQFLFVGGDTAYHIADYQSLSTRFRQPFRWAFASIRKFLERENRLAVPLADEEGHIPLLDQQGKVLRSDSEPARPIFGIPGNHDYYDVIDGFNRQFRRPPLEEHTRGKRRPQLSIPGFERQQNASYVALHLPFGWWFWGFDSEVSQLDMRQEVFFRDSASTSPPAKLILATPEPTTVFRKRKADDDKTLAAFEQLGLKQPFEAVVDESGKCRLDLSGDVHHYARYYGPNTKNLPTQPARSSDHYASVVAGGGGAFLHPSETHISGDAAIEEQVLYPPADLSRKTVANALFDLRNIFAGGYVWLFGMIITGIVYFAATVPQTSKNVLEWLFSEGHIPFVKDSNFLPDLDFPSSINPDGFISATILLIVAMLILGIAIYLFSLHVRRLAAAPVIFDDDTSSKTVAKDNAPAATVPTTGPPPTRYRDLWPIGALVTVALVLYFAGVVKFVMSKDSLHPFAGSLLVLGHLIIAAELLVLSTQNSAWLMHRTKFRTGKEFRYLPMWLLTLLGTFVAFFGIWMFGLYPGAYLLSDSIFILIVVGLLIALTGLSVTVGGELQHWPGKLLMGVLGFWHAILQLAVPLVLVRIGDWRALIAAIILILVFSGLSLPYTRVRIPGVGVWLMKLSESVSRIALVIGWLIYGGLLLWLPLKWNDERSILQTHGGKVYTSFLPQSALDWLALTFRPSATAWLLLSVAILMALLFGFLLSMSWLSWYFATALAFHGHNNEVGGAARLEKFRHILRIRLTRDGVTTYVIGFDEPAVEGHDLELKLLDVFHLRVT
jgi:hypothetical protein